MITRVSPAEPACQESCHLTHNQRVEGPQPRAPGSLLKSTLALRHPGLPLDTLSLSMAPISQALLQKHHSFSPTFRISCGHICGKQDCVYSSGWSFWSAVFIFLALTTEKNVLHKGVEELLEVIDLLASFPTVFD